MVGRSRFAIALSVCLVGCGPSNAPEAPSVAEVAILPNDTVLRVAGDEFATATGLRVELDGSLLVDRTDGAPLRIDPVARSVVPASTSNGSVTRDDSPGPRSASDQRPRELRADLPDGGAWTVTDSIPRLQRVSSAGVVEVDVPIVDVQLTPIRVRAARREMERTEQRPVRYATDINVVGSTVWVLLNVSVEEGAVLLGFSTEGRQLYRLELPATEGGRFVAWDTTRARLYAVGPEIPLVLAVELRGYESFWR